MKQFLIVSMLVLGGAMMACESSSGTTTETCVGTACQDVIQDVTENPGYDVPKTDTPATDTPVTDAPKTDNPVTDTPVTDTPVTDTPVTDTPVTDTPVTDTPVTDTKPDTPVTDVAGEETTVPCQPCPYFGECIQDCPAGAAGQACQQDCLAQLCPQDQQDFQAFYNCLSTNGCLQKTTNEEYGACIDQFCLDPYFKCYSGELYAGCADLMTCLNSCPDDDPNTTDVNEMQVCAGDCFSNATYQANSDYQAMFDCIDTNCTTCGTDWQGTTCQNCINTVLTSGGACNANYVKCAPHGDKTCSEVWTCLLACQDQACAQGCYASGTLTGQDLAGKWVDCALAQCTDGSIQCIDGTKTAACKTQWDACAADNAAQ
jgi:hypothetical protein